MNLSYYISLILLFLFGCVFFTFDLYIGKIKELQSNRLLYQSGVYLDSSIDNAGGLLQNGVDKAKIAMLLNPNQDTEENYLKLLFRTDPTQALIQWSLSSLVKDNVEEKSKLLTKCIISLQDSNLEADQAKIIARIALQVGEELEKLSTWIQSPTNALSIANLLAEVGHPDKAFERAKEIMEKSPGFPDAVFLATKLAVHTKDRDSALLISRKLAKLSSRRNQIGIEAVRHMTLLNLLQPLSESALLKCVELLRSNSSSKPIDFLRVYALLYSKNEDQGFRNETIKKCASLFNLNDRNELLIFSNWLGRLGAFEHLAYFIPASQAKVDEELFKLRMSALAQLGDLERIGQELNDAPIIPLLWRLVVEARSLSLGGRYDESRKTIDRLLPLVDEDPRKVRAVCYYLESVKDLTNLSHILEKLIEKPIHQKFALNKLIQYRATSAELNDLISWLSKLQAMRKQDPELENAYLYFRLLDDQLFPSSSKLDNLITLAEEGHNNYGNHYTQISLALAHLRNDDPSQALVSLGNPKDWRKWASQRPAWAFIASQIYKKNHDSEKASILQQQVDFSQMDKAERESLQKLFSSSDNE